MMRLLIAVTFLYLFVLPAATFRHVPLEYPRNETKVKFGGTFGVDVSQPVSTDSFECMKSNGIDFVIVRAYQSFG